MSSKMSSSISIDDRDGNVTYVPVTWTVHTNVESIYHLWGNTDTFSDIQNATATVKFYGNAIEYWGNQGPYHGPCLISIDGQEMTTVNSHAAADGYPIMLFSKSDLSLGNHELQVRVVNPSYPNVCEVDRFVVNVTSSTGGNTGNGGSGNSGGGTTNNNDGTPARRKSGPPIGIIAGAAGAALAIFIAILLWMWFRQRSKRRRVAHEKISKPVFVDDDGGYHVTPNSAPGVVYTSLSTQSQQEPSTFSYRSSSVNTSVYVPSGGTFNPYATHHNTVLGTPSPSSQTFFPPPANGSASASSSSGRNQSDQPMLHMRNSDHLVPGESPSLVPTNNMTSTSSQHHHPSASYLAKEREAFASAVPQPSGSGSSGAHYGRVVTSPDVEPELPPPAYEG